jgi:NADH dehydrogenase/NADH:ubiquinone oxidoreductase subunit G
MCLVELKNSVNPVVSCCTIIIDSMIVYTDTLLIRRSREYILEFLLINHPLDCPICDQAGECDLQDLTLIYGSDHSKFNYNKKSILNKKVGPFIKTQMNRCIYCTRCVRYSHELNNTYSFNTLGRSGYSEIGNYYFNNIMNNSYVHGNVIDLCPVGALTAKPNTFRNRP